MISILLDANIIITYLTRRDDLFIHEIDTLFQLCTEKRLTGYVSLQTISAIWYVLRKFPEVNRRYYLQQICSLLKLAVTDMPSVQNALANSAFRDFEDNLQACCAQSVNADYIVKANVHDYEGHSSVEAITPDELLKILEDNGAENNNNMEVQETTTCYEVNSRPIDTSNHANVPSPSIFSHIHRSISKGHRQFCLTTRHW